MVTHHKNVKLCNVFWVQGVCVGHQGLFILDCMTSSLASKDQEYMYIQCLYTSIAPYNYQ